MQRRTVTVLAASAAAAGFLGSRLLVQWRADWDGAAYWGAAALSLGVLLACGLLCRRTAYAPWSVLAAGGLLSAAPFIAAALARGPEAWLDQPFAWGATAAFVAGLEPEARCPVCFGLDRNWLLVGGALLLACAEVLAAWLG